MANDVLKVIRGISQALSKNYDGAYEKDGWTDFYDGDDREPVKIGLKREKYDNINVDSRNGLMDGFGCHFHGNKLCIKYHGEVNMKDIHRNGPKKFENEIEQTFADIAKYLRKEYKKITDSALTLSSQGDASVHVQNMSKIRSWVQASKRYKIGGMSGVESVDVGSPEDRLDDSIKKWLAIGKDSYPKTKKPQNVTRKGE